MIPSAEATRLVRKLAALPDPLMREHVLVEVLARTSPEEAVSLLDEIQTHGQTGTPPFHLALLALVGVLSKGLLDYEQSARLYAAAKETDRGSLTQLFLSSQLREAGPEPTDEQRRELTLGHRKWMARGRRREQLDRLLRNPEAEVVPLLLENPRLVEADVVRLAARRPATAEVQRSIFSSRRWITRYAVKRALVLNPGTPTDLSIRLLGFLNSRDLGRVAASPTLPAPVRAAASRLVAREQA